MQRPTTRASSLQTTRILAFMEARVQGRHPFGFHRPHSPNFLQPGISLVLPNLRSSIRDGARAGLDCLSQEETRRDQQPGFSQQQVLIAAVWTCRQQFNPLMVRLFPLGTFLRHQELLRMTIQQELMKTIRGGSRRCSMQVPPW